MAVLMLGGVCVAGLEGRAWEPAFQSPQVILGWP